MSRICEGCQQGAHKLCDGCDCDACEPLDEETAAGAEQPSAPPQPAPEFCSCEIPTQGKTTPRCGTCDKLYRPAAESSVHIFRAGVDGGCAICGEEGYSPIHKRKAGAAPIPYVSGTRIVELPAAEPSVDHIVERVFWDADKAKKDINAAIAAAKREGLEEAARLQCTECAKGTPIAPATSPVMQNLWHKEANFPAVRCEAMDIVRAIGRMERLTKEQQNG